MYLLWSMIQLCFNYFVPAILPLGRGKWVWSFPYSLTFMLNSNEFMDVRKIVFIIFYWLMILMYIWFKLKFFDPWDLLPYGWGLSFLHFSVRIVYHFPYAIHIWYICFQWTVHVIILLYYLFFVSISFFQWSILVMKGRSLLFIEMI